MCHSWVTEGILAYKGVVIIECSFLVLSLLIAILNSSREQGKGPAARKPCRAELLLFVKKTLSGLLRVPGVRVRIL